MTSRIQLGATQRSRQTRPLTAAGLAVALCAMVLPFTARPLSAQDPGGVVDEAAGPVVAAAIEVRGTQRESAAAVLAAAGLRAGEPVNYRDIQAAIRRLWGTGRYADVQIYARPTGTATVDPVVLVIEVEERPHIAGIEFEGLEHVKPSLVRDTVGLQADGPLDPAKVAEAEAMTRRLLAQEGFYARSIEHRLEPIEGRTGEFLLVFDVDEGRRIALAEIQFEGNEVFSDRQLRRAMAAKTEGLLWYRTGVYNREQVEQDFRESLPSFYAERGYIDFAVVDDSLVVDPETGKARLTVEVDEGQQYRLAEFDIVGNRRFPTETLQRYFDSEQEGLIDRLKIGGGRAAAEELPPFDRIAFESALQRVNQLYRNEGYLYAQLEPVIERVETESGEPAVRAVWQIREGEPAYINRVTIRGNTYTHERVIREQIYLLPGDVYNEQLLLQSYQGISGLGFFETPVPLPEIKPNEDGDVDIVFEVEEKQTGSINFGTAIGGTAGIAGFLGYDQPNLFGQAKSGHLRWEYGQYTNNFQASYRDPAILDSRVSGSASLFSMRNSRYFRFNEGDYRQTGGSLQVGLPIPQDPRTRFTVGYSLVQTSYSGESDLFRLPTSTRSTVSAGLTRNTLNHPLFPTAGTRQTVQSEVSGGILGGQGDFQKLTSSGTWYVPAGQLGGTAPGSRPIRFTLGLSTEVGAIFGDPASLALFPFERFWMGGVNFGTPLRGYPERTITPLGFAGERAGVALTDRLGDAYLRISAEYAARLNDNLSISLFYDAGNIWSSPSEINPTRLLRGAGIGLTLVTPFGPLGLDYAYGFDRTDALGNPNPAWELHFKFGPSF